MDNWSAVISLSPGTNVIQVYAADAAGNDSLTNHVTIFYQVKTPLSVSMVGKGTISPNYNDVSLVVTRTYSMTATAAAGFKFNGWTGSGSTNGRTLAFVMEPGLSFTANFTDITRPSIVITRPVPGAIVTNGSLTVTGTAHDNVGVANVNYSLNGSGFTTANSTNNWTNWSANVSLNPGTNTVRVFATDAAGNVSPTNGVAFFYVLRAPLTVNMEGGRGMVSITNGTELEVGKSYVITVVPGAGFAFSGWTGSVSGTNASLRFTMEQGTVLTANFNDVARPTVSITSPLPGQITANANILIMGTAHDNLAVASVSYQLNGGGWNTAQTFNNWATWMAAVTLTPGANVAQAFSTDTTGHFSNTNSVRFTYAPPKAFAPTSLQGFMAQITPASSAQFTTLFGASNCSETMTGSPDFSGVGDYTYTRSSSNSAQLSINFILPPTSVTETDVIDLTFTADDSGTYVDETISGDTGTFNLFPISSLAPTMLGNTTVHATDSSDEETVLSVSGSTFTEKDTGGSTFSGTYTYKKYSPRVGMIVLAYTDAVMGGATNYVQLTYDAAGSGSYLVTLFDTSGNFAGTDTGTFTVP